MAASFPLITMYIDFSKLFHQSSKDASGGGTVHIPKNNADWPLEWKTTYYKTYRRLPVVRLRQPRKIKTGLSHALFFRKTERNFSGRPFSFADFSTLLEGSLGITTSLGEKSRRAYPSGGARFPIEAYPIVLKGSKELPAGVYHYNPKSHDLSVLWEREFTAADIAALTPYEWVAKASLLLVFTAVFQRNQQKYGERGYRYILLEAGHMGENVYLTANALGLKCAGLGGVRDERVESMLDIDGVAESVVYALALGT